MTDLLKAFEPLTDEFYPGSKQRRRESQQMRRSRLAAERREALEAAGWDYKPLEIWLRQWPGQKPFPAPVKFEMFKIGALAKALGRDSVTIRAWIRKGWLPRNMFQTPRVYGSRGDAGRRLWTRSQIEGIVRIAREERLLEEHPPRIQTTRFTERVLASWKGWR